MNEKTTVQRWDGAIPDCFSLHEQSLSHNHFSVADEAWYWVNFFLHSCWVATRLHPGLSFIFSKLASGCYLCGCTRTCGSSQSFLNTLGARLSPVPCITQVHYCCSVSTYCGELPSWGVWCSWANIKAGGKKNLHKVIGIQPYRPAAPHRAEGRRGSTHMHKQVKHCTVNVHIICYLNRF